jgi:hypothetical protein
MKEGQDSLPDLCTLFAVDRVNQALKWPASTPDFA